METQRCLYCGGDAAAPSHRCGTREAQAFDALPTGERRRVLSVLGAVADLIVAAVPAPPAHFDGETYESARDRDRLHAQLFRVLGVMRDRQWHTLRELGERASAPEASVSARLRDLRKPKFGGHVIERRHVERGLCEYRMVS